MSRGDYRPRLIIFVKAPVIGRCKTRLAKDIGAGRAIAFYRHATKRLTGELAGNKSWQTILAIDPYTALSASLWPSNIARISQGSGDLGARMGAVFRQMPPGPVIIIGSDTPHISRRHIAEAFDRLNRKDAVFGPAADGGYWLIGLNRQKPAAHLFDAVRWSSAHTLEDTIASLPKFFQVGYLPTLHDVDTGADYRQGVKQLRRVAISDNNA